ncbi:glutamate racemase [Peptococcaceae bacterium 1198_IL3148]
MAANSPIGIFDSGVGGLSIAKEIRKLLPHEDLLYFADSAYCPYGEKLPTIIKDRVFAICDFLISKGAKMLVVACNTASIVSLDDIRSYYKIPVIGVEPAVKPAVAATKTGTIGVLATGVTLSGDRFSSLVKRYGDQATVVTQPCPGLVELVEKGQTIGPETEAMLTNYLQPLLNNNADTIVLGCTHYPFLRPLIHKLVGNDITVIDTGEAVARQTKRMLVNNDLQNDQTNDGQETIFTSGNVESVQPVVRLLWNKPSLEVKYIETGGVANAVNR